MTFVTSSWVSGRRSIAGDAARAIGMVALALGVGATVAMQPALVLMGTAAIGLVAAIAMRPALGVYLLVVLIPLTAGIDRGTLIPVLRPSEALTGIVAGALLLRWGLRVRSTRDLSIRVDSVSGAVLLLAVMSSVLPLVWLKLRGQPMTSDDVFYALVVWKFYIVFATVRGARLNSAQIRRCLAFSVGTAVVVGLIATLQAGGVGFVIHALSSYYTTNDNVDALSNSRGSSTLALPIAVADLLSFNLALVVAWLCLDRKRSRPLLLAGAALLVGIASAAEFSGYIGLVVGVVALCVALRSTSLLRYMVPGMALAVAVAWPAVSTRLAGFSSGNGLPVSWTGRLYNLQNYFWPVLFTQHRYLLGVRPAARIPDPHRANGFIWIESGYTWLLWAGGIPLLVAFVAFVVITARTSLRVARSGDPAPRRVSATAAFVAIVITTVLMTFDPHLTYRGSADELFILLALACPTSRAGDGRSGRKPSSTERGSHG